MNKILGPLLEEQGKYEGRGN